MQGLELAIGGKCLLKDKLFPVPLYWPTIRLTETMDDEITSANVTDCTNFSDSFNALKHDSAHVQVIAPASPNFKENNQSAISNKFETSKTKLSLVWVAYLNTYQWIDWIKEPFLLKGRKYKLLSKRRMANKLCDLTLWGWVKNMRIQTYRGKSASQMGNDWFFMGLSFLVIKWAGRATSAKGKMKLKLRNPFKK